MSRISIEVAALAAAIAAHDAAYAMPTWDVTMDTAALAEFTARLLDEEASAALLDISVGE